MISNKGMQLVENLAQSTIYCDDYDRTNYRGGAQDENTRRELKAVHDQIDILFEKAEKCKFNG